MRRLLPPLAAAVVLIALAAAADAHDLFLRLDSYFVPPRTAVVIKVLNGTFVKSEGSVQRNRLREITLAANGTRRQLDTNAWTDTSKTVSTLTLQAGESATYVVGASVKPRLIALSAKELHGAPAIRQYVVAGSDPGSGVLAERGYRADSAGVVRVSITRRGTWYVKFIHMEPVKDSVDYESKWASLTFQVR